MNPQQKELVTRHLEQHPDMNLVTAAAAVALPVAILPRMNY